MSRILNLKEHILKTAKDLSKEQGIAALSVRMVAQQSGIALGSIYNYYPTKGDLIAAVIEDFWKEAFSGIDFSSLRKAETIAALEQIYFQLLGYLCSFKENWLEQLSMLSTADKSAGRAKEKEYLAMVSAFIQKLLEQDTSITGDYAPEELKKLSRFILEQMLILLREGEQDLTLFKKILGRILYS
ncbi:MAG: TetR/AcrR family transcriptional regulator [Angelakisella sp.]